MKQSEAGHLLPETAKKKRMSWICGGCGAINRNVPAILAHFRLGQRLNSPKLIFRDNP